MRQHPTLVRFRKVESRLSIMRDVIEDVEYNNMGIKVICGMGGVGKNTMVIQKHFFGELWNFDNSVESEGRFQFNDGDHVRTNVETLLSHRSRDERYRLHKRYIDFNNDELARRSPPKTVSEESWIDLCDLYADPNYQRRCAINKENSSKKTIPHNTESRAFVVERHHKHKETVIELGRIDFYHHTHFKNGKWMSIEAKKRYEEMDRLRKEPTTNGSQLTEDEIADRVLGTRSNCILRLGYDPKPSKSTRTTGSSHSKAQHIY